MSKRWAACRCFYRRNFYVKQIDEHLEYTGDDTEFLRECRNSFKDVDPEPILQQVKNEMSRRRSRFKEFSVNRKNILSNYKPTESFCSINTQVGKHTELFQDIYRLPVLDKPSCDVVLRELERFHQTGLKHSQPTSMRKHGVIFNEVGLESLIDKLIPTLESLSRQLFTDFIGDSGFDSYKAFTVEYDAEDEKHMKDLGTHFDNSEVTLNISLTDDHEGGELYFVR